MYKFFEDIKLAVKSIWAKKTRSILTMLGVIIGVFAIVLLIGIGEGVKSEVTSQIEGLGSNLLFVIPGKIEGGNMPTAVVGTSTLTDEDIKSIKSVEGIEEVTPIMIIGQPVFRDGKGGQNIITLGTTPNISKTFMGEWTETSGGGRFLTKADEENKDKVAVIFEGAKDILFPNEDPVGKEIKIGKERFEVVGWREAPQSTSSSIMGGNEFSSLVIIPITTAEEVTGSSEIHRIMIKVSDTDLVSTKQEEIKELLLANHENIEDFSVMTQEDILDVFDTILDVLTTMLAGIAAISLLVGGIGVMNIMLVSVTERTKEIGLRKAIGASSSDILIQFLVEAIFLTFLGGAIGVGLAFIGKIIMDVKFGLAPVISVESIAIAFGFTVLVGIFFGVAPAIRASRLDPIKALKYE